MLYKRDNSNLWGLRLLDKDGIILCSAGGGGDACWLLDPDYAVKRSNPKVYGLKKVHLDEGHVLCGVKSGTRGGIKQSRHYDFNFYIGHIEQVMKLV